MPNTVATRQYYADNCDKCIEEAVSGAVHVNDLPKYIEWQTQSKADFLSGKNDRTLAFQQTKHWLATGECIPLLPKPKEME